jgi:hypothetical protein
MALFDRGAVVKNAQILPANTSRKSAHRVQFLKSGLLVGASIATMIALTSNAFADGAPAAPAPTNKWLPYVSVGGQLGGGGASGGTLTGFDPVWQDLNSLVYIRLNVGVPTHKGLTTDIGVGYRTKIDGDWIGGIYGGFDFSDTANHHGFTQGSLGAEAMSADWDARINGYLTFKGEPRDIAGAKELFISDTRIAILQGQEWAYSGFDGEVGYRVFNTDNIDVRVFAGGFDYTRDSSKTVISGQNFNLGAGDIAGPMGRAELDLYNIAMFGPQSRLSLSGTISNDDVRGTTGFVGAALRIPLGNSDDDATDELDRRMVDQVRRRDGVLTESGFTKPEPVIMSNGHITSAPTNTLYYVDNTVGAGSYADPTTLKDATSRPAVNQFIVLTDKGGPVVASGVTLRSGETVTAPGTFTVTGANSGTTFVHTFAPGSGPVSITTTDANGITLASNTNLYGLHFTGPFTNAIYGHNVTNVDISGVTIAGGGTGTNGIYLHDDNGTSSHVSIDNTTITGVTNDGVKIAVDNATGSTATNVFDLTNITATAGVYGVGLTETVTGGSDQTTALNIHNSTLTGGTAGVKDVGTVFAGSSLNSSLLIDPTHLTGGQFGVLTNSTADGGSLTETIDLSQVYITGTARGGIQIVASALNGGALDQTVNMTDVTVSGSLYPVSVAVSSLGAGSTATQAVTMERVTASGGTYDNITFDIYSGYGGTGHQHVVMNDVTAINSRYGDGVSLTATAYEDATATQTVDIYDLTATGNYSDGVFVSGFAGNLTAGSSAITAQYVTITDSDISHNANEGVFAKVTGSDQSVARQDLTVSYSTLDYNGFGIEIESQAGFYGASQQNVILAYDDVSHNTYGGAAFVAEGFLLGSASQTVNVYGGTFNDNGGDGIYVGALTFAAGQVQQNVGIYNATATGNAGDGLFISTNAYGYSLGTYAYYSHIGQNVTAAYDNFSGNARNGVEVNNYAGYGAQVNQVVYLYSDHMDHEGPTSGPVPVGAGSGVYEKSVAEAYGYYGGAITTNLYADTYIVNSTADNNAIEGVLFKGTADGPTYMIQHLVVSGLDASYNGRSGLVAYAAASNFYSLNIQYVTLAGSTFDHNTFDGAAFVSTQHYGPLSFGASIQDVTIQNSTFSNNTVDGLYATANAFDVQGRAEQHFTISGSEFDDNGASGAVFKAHAHDGVYVAGYACSVAQGLGGGCAFVRETVQIVGSEFDNNGADGIYMSSVADNYGAVYNASGRPVQPTLLIEYSQASGNGANGLEIQNHASNYSYVYSYAVLLGSNFDNNGGSGVLVSSMASSGSGVGQKTIMYGVPGYATTADHNGVDGLHVYSGADGGTVQQLVGVYYSDLSYNGSSGANIAGFAHDTGANFYPSIVSQYISAIGSDFYANNQSSTAVPGPGGYSFTGGFVASAYADGANSVAQQQIHAIGNYFGYNYVGLQMAGVAHNGAAINQYLDSEYNVFFGNGTGENIRASSDTFGFTTQGLYDNVNTFAYNGVGFALSATAHTAGNVQQNATLYNDNVRNNGGDGVDISTTIDGYGFGPAYIYYSHASQNVLAYNETSSANNGNGVSVINNVTYGGALDQFLYFSGLTASGNNGNGFYLNTTMDSVRGNSFSFATNVNSTTYLTGSTLDGNAGNGASFNALAQSATYIPSFFGGYSYLIQHVHVSGSDFSNNSGAGLVLDAGQLGVYTLNAEYLTIAGSHFDHNGAQGANFVSTSFFGPGGFGDNYENFQIQSSSFDSNGGDGIAFTASSTGRQGRAEQHATLTGVTADNNGANGVNIYASAQDGVYVAGHSCDTVQGLAGGCTFVRQNVTIIGSDISGNANDGVQVITYANNYGAIYGGSGRPHAPTLNLYGDTINNNNNRGLNISNHVTNHSYLYQYAAMIDTIVSHNHSDGIYASSYVGTGSEELQRTLLYSYHTGASSSDNAGNGFKDTVEALGGSYIRDVNIVQGANLVDNGSFGFDGAIAYADAGSVGVQINAVYFNAVSNNGDGIGLYSIGGGAQQISYIGTNSITGNSFVGVYGEANFGAFQYIGVYTFGNTVNSNGTDYLFNAFGGSTQILN